NRPRHFPRLARTFFLDRFADAAKPESHHAARAGLDRERIMRRGFCPHALGIHRLGPSIDDKIVDAVFDERVSVRRRKKARGVGFVLGEKEIARVFAVQLVVTQRAMARLNGWATAREIGARPKRGPAIVAAPCPGVAEPE